MNADCGKCDNPHQHARCPWEEQPCGVEGCRYQMTADDGCGLAKLVSTDESIRAWDAGSPTHRLCLAMQRAESIVWTARIEANQ